MERLFLRLICLWIDRLIDCWLIYQMKLTFAALLRLE